MPIYEYYCKKCDQKFQARRPISEADAPIKCEHCQSKRTTRQLSRFAVHSSGRSEASSGGGGGCAGCSGGSCASCGH